MSDFLCPLSKAAHEFKDQTALIWGPRQLTFQQLDQCVHSTIRQLKKAGFSSGQRVALSGRNCAEFVILLLALWRMKIVTVCLNFRMPENLIGELIKKTECRFFLTTEDQLRKSRKIHIRTAAMSELIHFDIRDSLEPPEYRFALDDPLTIIMTSGTTHLPKAALHSFGNHYYNALGANENLPLKNGDRWLLSLPLFHVGGLGIVWRTILSGSAMVIQSEDEDLIETLVKNKITHLSLVPTQLNRLLEQQRGPEVLKTVKAILLGGSPIADSLKTQIKDHHLPIFFSYGLTEMTSQVATSRQSTIEESASLIKALNYRELRIDSDKEILVRGQTLFKGYLEARRLQLPLSDDGWFRTGDLGQLDERGSLRILGRKDNLFISGGENIQPEEIEIWLGKYPGIQQALVIPREDAEFGCRPVAFLQVEVLSCFDLGSLVSFLEQQLPRFKIPLAYYHWPDESVGSFKVSRKSFQDAFNDPHFRLEKFV